MSVEHPRGFWGIGIYRPKTSENVGTLFRGAMSFGASFIFTVGRRYQRQVTDTTKTPRHVPLYNYDSIEDLVAHLPMGCPLVGVELTPDAEQLSAFRHPERACYLLGAEDHGLPPDVLFRCHRQVVVPGAAFCLNVSVAGSIVMYDRTVKAAA